MEEVASIVMGREMQLINNNRELLVIQQVIIWIILKSISTISSNFKLCGEEIRLVSIFQCCEANRSVVANISHMKNLEKQSLKNNIIQTKEEKEGLSINSKLVLSTKESGKEVSVMVMESKSGQMVPNMQENGGKIERMEKVLLCM